MPRDPSQRIEDVLDAIERCQRYVVVLVGDGDFVDMAEDAIERNLQIIGEAVTRLPEEISTAALGRSGPLSTQRSPVSPTPRKGCSG